MPRLTYKKQLGWITKLPNTKQVTLDGLAWHAKRIEGELKPVVIPDQWEQSFKGGSGLKRLPEGTDAFTMFGDKIHITYKEK